MSDLEKKLAEIVNQHIVELADSVDKRMKGKLGGLARIPVRFSVAELGADHLRAAVREAADAARQAERERTKQALRMLAWSDKDIEAFDSWGRTEPESLKGMLGRLGHMTAALRREKTK